MKHLYAWIGATLLLVTPLAAQDVAQDGPRAWRYTKPIYESDRFWFAVKLLEGYAACVANEFSHGIAILLDKSHTCEKPQQEAPPSIDVDGYYNTVFDRGDVKQFGQQNCELEKARELRVLDLTLSDGRPVFGCELEFSDGTRGMKLTALAGESARGIPWIEIIITMRSASGRMREDTDMLMNVLAGLTIKPEESQGVSFQIIPRRGTLIYSATAGFSPELIVSAENGSPAYLVTLARDSDNGHFDLVLRRPNAKPDARNRLEPQGNWHGLQKYNFDAVDFVNGAERSAFGKTRQIHVRRRELDVMVSVSNARVRRVGTKADDPSSYVFDDLAIDVEVDNAK